MAERAPAGPGRLLRSAAYRIAFAYSGAFALALLALGTGVYLAADAEFRREQDAAIETETQALVRDFSLEGVGELRRDIARRETGHATNVFGYALLDASGRRIAGALSPGGLTPGWHQVDVALSGEESDEGRALATQLPTGETLVVAVDTDPLESIDRTVLYFLAAGFAAMATIGIAGALLLGRYLRARLERIGGTAAAIATGNLDRRVPVSTRADEFDQLAVAINAMLDRIGGLMESLRQVSADLAHDLRTPLSRMRANLEAGLAQGDPARLRATAEQALRNNDELLSLFASILRIAEVERMPSRATEIVDLAELAGDIVDSYAPAVIDGGRSLDLVSDGESTPVAADGALLAQALANLIDNAQLHTPPGTVITVEVRRMGTGASLTVADDGPGVPARDRSRITERFVRLESSRTTPGHGLGLNIVAAIVRAHGGTLAIDDNKPGLRVILGFAGGTTKAGT